MATVVARALVLPELGGDITGQDDRDIGAKGAGHRSLVLIVAVGVQEADGHRIHPLGHIGDGAERDRLFPLRIQPTGDLQSQRSLHQRLGPVRPDVVQRGAGLAGDLDDVARGQRC